MASIVEQRTAELLKLQTFFESERDKLYDQVANLQGQKDRLDWTIRVINAQLESIKKEEAQREAYTRQQNEAMTAAREAGNVGTHPNVRKEGVAARKAQAKKEKSSTKKKEKKAANEE